MIAPTIEKKTKNSAIFRLDSTTDHPSHPTKALAWPQSNFIPELGPGSARPILRRTRRIGRAEPKAKRKPITFSTARHQTSSRWVSRRGRALTCAAPPLYPSYEAPGDSPDEALLSSSYRPPGLQYAEIARAKERISPADFCVLESWRAVGLQY